MTGKKRLGLTGAAVVLLLCGLAATAWAQGARRGAPFDTRAERIGPLRLGLGQAAARRAVSCRPRPGREFFEAATGDFVQDLDFPGCGLRLKMAGPRKGGPKTVAAVTVTAPCALTTGRGVGIGATEAAVRAAYGRFQDEEGLSRAGEAFVAGSVYDGLMFRFKGGRVSRLFLGAAAE
ncbi:MAG: hypothetical protein ACP59X_02065 [Solidesulfovibrio sp. DCME]|uniref:hypothetical protein n=1 Tax=Solidesulfovibrio sp. DCME TaxID=3447380 RepID=UPI003D14E7F9